jgi:hypothetical protein
MQLYGKPEKFINVEVIVTKCRDIFGAWRQLPERVTYANGTPPPQKVGFL